MFISQPLRKIISDPTANNSIANIFDTQKSEINTVLQKFVFSLNILEHSLSKIKEAYAILEELGGITVQARNLIRSNINSDMTDVIARYNTALKKLDKNSETGAINNTNLLMGDTLTTVLDNKGLQKITTNGLLITAKNLEFRAPDFSSEMNIRNSRIDVMNAMDVVVALKRMIMDDIFTITTAKEFAEKSIIAANDGQMHISSPLNITESQLLLLLNQRELPFTLAEEAQAIVLKNFAQQKPNKE